KSKEKMRFDNFERLVGQRGAVDADLAPHSPRRMSQRVLNRCSRQPLDAPVTERAAGCREHHSPDLRRRMSSDALQYGAVLTVDRNNFARSGSTRLPDQIARNNQCL